MKKLLKTALWGLLGLPSWDHRYEQLCARFEAAGGVMERKVFEDAVFSVSQPEPIALPSID